MPCHIHKEFTEMLVQMFSPVKTSSRRPAVLTEALRGFLQPV